MWQALDAQVTVGGDFADDEAGLVNGGDDEAMRRAAADGDDDVAEIVCCRVQSFQACADFFCELIFVAGDGGGVDELFEFVGERAVRDCWFLRLRGGWKGVQKTNG